MSRTPQVPAGCRGGGWAPAGPTSTPSPSWPVRTLSPGTAYLLSYRSWDRTPEPPGLRVSFYDRGVKLIFSGGHISLVVAFKGPNVILGLYKCNYSLTRGKDLSAATRSKQGAQPDKARCRARFGPRALCLPPVLYDVSRLVDKGHKSLDVVDMARGPGTAPLEPEDPQAPVQ